MLDHAVAATVGGDEAEPAEQVQVVAQQRAHGVLHRQAVLQQDHLRPRRRDLVDQRRQGRVAGGLRRHQQPVAGRHVRRVGVGVQGLRPVVAELLALQLQAVLLDRREVAAEQEVHLRAGPRQQHAEETADGAGTDDRYTLVRKAHGILLIRMGAPAAWASCVVQAMTLRLAQTLPSSGSACGCWLPGRLGLSSGR
ncbi:hypothetical protein D3C81_1523590 [compost metagenome]